MPGDAHPLSGRFIVLDGGEGCGKSTQLRRLSEALEGEGARLCRVRDPGGTPAGERIRDLLLDPTTQLAMRAEMLLYMASRADLVPGIIEPALADGQVVLADRFVSSTLAYQLGGDGLTFEEIGAVARVATAGRMPDLTILLDVPTDVAQARVVPKYVPMFDADADGDKDRIERRPLDYHRRVRDNYLALAEREPGRHVVIDASADVDAVAAGVRETLRERLGG